MMAPRAETTAEGIEFPDADDNLFVLEFPGELGLFVVVHGVIEGHEQAIAGRVNVLAGDDLAFDQAFLPDVFIRPITGD